MKTLSVSEGSQNLDAWLKRALRGEDVGFVVDGRVIALRPVETHDDEYALREYGADEGQLERAYQSVESDVRKARESGETKPFNGKL